MMLSSRAKIVLALLFCISIRFLYVYLPTVASPSPRMGDDSLVYIWKAKLDFVLKDYNQQAIHNVKKLDVLARPDNVKDHWWVNRIVMRTYGLAVPAYEFFISSIYRLGLTHGKIFLYSEILILLLYSFGSLFLLWQFVPLQFLSSALILTLFQPDRFVATNLSAALSFFLWALVFKIKKKSNIFLFLILMILTYFSHPIGLVLVAIFVAFDFLVVRSIYRTVLFAGVQLSLLFTKQYIFSWTESYTAKGTGHIAKSFSEIWGNIIATFEYMLLDPGSSFIILFACIGLGRLLISTKFKISIRNLSSFSILMIILVMCLMTTYLFVVPGYPAELANRVLVIICLCLSGFSVSTFYDLFKDKAKIIFGFLVVCFTLFGIRNFREIALSNVNGRHYLVNESKFKEEIDKTSDSKQILVLEFDHLFMYGLISSPEKNLIPYNLIEAGHLPNDVLNDELITVMPLPLKLNSLAYLGNNTFRRRQYGISLKDSRLVLVKGISSSKVLIKLTKLKSDLMIYTGGKNGMIQVYPQRVSKDWYEIKSETSIDHLKIIGSESDVWLLGVKRDSNNPNMSWPWGDDSLEVLSFPIKEKPYVLKFDNGSLFEPLVQNLLNSYQSVEYLSDESGALFISLKRN